VKDAAAGAALVQRITDLATAEGAPRASCLPGCHPPHNSLLTHPCRWRRRAGHSARAQVGADNTVHVELSTTTIGGLSENDFIIAAKVDTLSLTDLLVVAKKRTYYF
jgi:hypothetical protein